MLSLIQRLPPNDSHQTKRQTLKKSDTEEPRMIHVRLSVDKHRQLRVLAAQRDTSIQGLVSALIERELKSAGKTTGKR